MAVHSGADTIATVSHILSALFHRIAVLFQPALQCLFLHLLGVCLSSIFSVLLPHTSADYSRSGYRAQEYELHTADTGSTTDACIQQDTDRGNKAMHTATYKYKSQCGSDIGFSRKTDETSDALL